MGSYLAPIDVPRLENHDEPLISIKLSIFPKSSETAIGVMMSHQVGKSFISYLDDLETPYLIPKFYQPMVT